MATKDDSVPVVREARLSDKDAVMRIRDVYGGRDYLLSYYDSFVTSDNCFAYVVVIDGEIVAFAAAYLVDGMKTMVSRASRIHPKHTGKKLTNLMIGELIKRINELGVEREYFTTNAGSLAMDKESFKNRNKFILGKEGLSYLVERSKWVLKNSVNHQERTNQIREVTDDDLDLYISTESYRDYLFPDGVIVIDWVPYKPLKSNIKLITNVDNRLILSDVRQEKSTIKGMLSIASLFQCSARFYGCNLDIYGRDISSFKRHLLQCIEFLTSKTKDPISLVIFVDSQMNGDELKNVANNLGLQEYPWVENEIRLNKLFLFESKL